MAYVLADGILEVANASRDAAVEDGVFDQVVEQNPIAADMWKNKETQEGGERLRFAVSTAEPGTYQGYDSATDDAVPLAENNNVFQFGYLDWREGKFGTGLPGRTDYMNLGEGELINLFDETHRLLMKQLVRVIDRKLFTDDGTGTQWHGLEVIKNNAADYAELDSTGPGATAPNHLVQEVDAANGRVTEAMFIEMDAKLKAQGAETKYIAVSLANWTEILGFKNVYRMETKASEDQNRTQLRGFGMRLFWGNAEILLCTNCPDDYIAWLDMSGLKIKTAKAPHRQFNIGNWRWLYETHDIDRYETSGLFAGNIICTNRQKLGFINNIDPTAAA